MLSIYKTKQEILPTLWECGKKIFLYSPAWKKCSLRISSVIIRTPGANTGFDVPISPADVKILIKANGGTVTKLWMHRLSSGRKHTSLCSGPVCSASVPRWCRTKTADPQKSRSGLSDQHSPLCFLFFLACEHTPR